MPIRRPDPAAVLRPAERSVPAALRRLRPGFPFPEEGRQHREKKKTDRARSDAYGRSSDYLISDRQDDGVNEGDLLQSHIGKIIDCIERHYSRGSYSATIP